jgi:hypothetical protein
MYRNDVEDTEFQERLRLDALTERSLLHKELLVLAIIATFVAVRWVLL